jgi:hypothetical protein
VGELTRDEVSEEEASGGAAAPRRAECLRPGDYARLALAGAGLPPRARARDQQADVVGEKLRRRVLSRLAALDPDGETLEATLVALAAEMGEPAGPTRAVCMSILQEWEMARFSPGFVSLLIEEALRADKPPPRTVQG